MVANILETERCVLRAFTPEDYCLIYDLHSHPDVMFYIGTGVRTKEQVAAHLDNIIKHQDKYGYSAWAVFEKSTGNFIGRCGLVRLGTLIAIEQDTNDNAPVEIGYVLSDSCWGKGYATELASACIAWGFCNTYLQEIVAKTNVLNHSSRKVLHKIGMNFQKFVEIEGNKGMYFSLSRDEYNLNNLQRKLNNA